jgi:hypothetical protein
MIDIAPSRWQTPDTARVMPMLPVPTGVYHLQNNGGIL